MQSPDLSTERAFLQRQLELLAQSFDQAVAKDAELGELKKIFHELRVLRNRLEQLDNSMHQNNE
jgi:hypothetical protein